MVASPHEDRVEHYRSAFRRLSEQAFIAAVEQIRPLADEDSPVWEEEAAWEDVDRLLAAADVIGERGWVAAIVPLYELAAKGELYETMPHLRHGPERAVESSQELAALLEPLTTHPRPGTREWVIRELGILRQRSSLELLLAALYDEDPDVADQARASLSMLAQDHPAVAGILDRRSRDSQMP